MANWFSPPIIWNTRMTVATDTENRMRVSINPGPIDVTALYDGFVVYRSTSMPPAPDSGSLELVLQPDKWPDNIQKHFNPDFPALAHFSGLTELPPGRIVYLNLARNVIKQGLHKLILDNFKIYLSDRTKIHRVLDFIDLSSPPSLKTLKVRLLEAWDSTPVDSERKKRVDAEINKNLDAVLSFSITDTVNRGLPIQGTDLLCTIGDNTSSAEVSFEIRNLYGEPLDPHFYLRKLGRTPTELAPIPPFPATEPSPRPKQANQLLMIRIPKDGGVEFNQLTLGAPTYQSPLVWTHQFDPGTGGHTTSLEPRPGANVEVPKLDANVQGRVNRIWDTDFFHINKHAEIFQVPCELIVATIFKEARPTATVPADLHSIRLELIERVAPYPVDYENLLSQSQVAGSLLTKKAIEAYYKLVGLWATNVKGLAFPPRQHAVSSDKYPRAKPVIPFQPTAVIGKGELLKELSWAQLAEIAQVKPELITAETMVLPALGKTKTGQYHYDLVTQATGLGAEVARIYWTNLGGVRLNQGKEELSQLPPVTLVSYPLPTNKDWVALVDPNDATKWIRWEQLLLMLNLLAQTGAKDIPEATYVLQPLQSLGNYSYQILFARPKLMAYLGVTDAQADDIMERYYTLMTQDVVFVPQVGPPPGEPGIQKLSAPVPDEYLTLTELKGVSRVYPGRISIGVGQILIDTANRFVIPWIRSRYGDSYFVNELAVGVPPATLEDRIPWIWDNLWDNQEFQIALIAAYHKQNATTFWQPGKDADGNKYKVGEMMTKFDFPRVAAAYNAGVVRKAFKPRAGNPDVDWGLHTFGDYFAPTWSAITYAITRFISIPPRDQKEARVRLRPDLEADSGMDPR